jgi:hypothetical protein
MVRQITTTYVIFKEEIKKTKGLDSRGLKRASKLSRMLLYNSREEKKI